MTRGTSLNDPLSRYLNYFNPTFDSQKERKGQENLVFYSCKNLSVSKFMPRQGQDTNLEPKNKSDVM